MINDKVQFVRMPCLLVSQAKDSTQFFLQKQNPALLPCSGFLASTYATTLHTNTHTHTHTHTHTYLQTASFCKTWLRYAAEDAWSSHTQA